MTGTLTQLKKSEASGLRTPNTPIKISFNKSIAIGERFNCFGKGLEFGVRLISTSPVKQITSANGACYEFETETGSHYELLCE